jgi:hypothetical protein
MSSNKNVKIFMEYIFYEVTNFKDNVLNIKNNTVYYKYYNLLPKYTLLLKKLI